TPSLLAPSHSFAFHSLQLLILSDPSLLLSIDLGTLPFHSISPTFPSTRFHQPPLQLDPTHLPFHSISPTSYPLDLADLPFNSVWLPSPSTQSRRPPLQLGPASLPFDLIS
ncbi:hypothetical protein PSTG_09510, partial [Puccinia striiformis f. sp. tritici PST-78]